MKLICFDLDSTLINSDRAHYQAYNKALEKMGFKRFYFMDMVKHFGNSKEEMAKILTSSKDKRVLRKFMELYEKLLINASEKNIRKIKGVTGILKKLKKNYKIGLLSNNSHKNILFLTKAGKLDKNLFDVIVGNDDVSHSKPCPDEILKAEKLLHLEAGYMVGDSIYDVIAGKKARVKTIAVLTGHYTRTQLKEYNPDHIIKSVKYLPKILKI